MGGFASDFGVQVSDPFGQVLSLNDDLAYGLVLGVDVLMGESAWFFNGGLKYLMASAQLTDQDDPDDGSIEIDFDPLMVFLGFGYGF